MNRSFFNSMNNSNVNTSRLQPNSKGKILDSNNSKFIDEQNSVIWSRNIKDNLGRKLIQYKGHSHEMERQYQQLVKDFLQGRNGTGQQDLRKQFMFQLRQRLTQDKVLTQMENIQNQLFYTPSNSLKQHLGPNWKDKIYKAVVMKLPDLEFQISTKQVEKQKQYIRQNVWGWGDTFLDLEKMQYFCKEKFAEKSGDGVQKTYDLPFYELQITVSKNSITVKYKNKQISPSEFKTQFLRQLAVERMSARAKNLIAQFTKYTQKKFTSQVQKMVS